MTSENDTPTPACDDRADTLAAAELAVEHLRGLHRHEGLLSLTERVNQFGPVSATDPKCELEVRNLISSGGSAYLSLNGYREGAARRIADNLGFVTSLFADLDYDVRDPGIHAAMIEREIDRCLLLLQQCGMPEPTLVARSGTGFWIHYWLCDDSGGSIALNSQIRERWNRAAGALVSLLKSFGLDCKEVDSGTSTDINRLARIPGSINEKTGARVVWRMLREPPSIYALDKIEQHLDQWMPYVSYTPHARAAAPTKKRKGRTTGKKGSAAGYIALAKQRSLDMRALQAIRGRAGNRYGASDKAQRGMRRTFARMIAIAQREVREPQELIDLVTRFGKNLCEPPLTDKEIRSALKWASSTSHGEMNAIRDLTIGKRLGITQAEQRHLVGAYLPGAKPKKLKPPRDTCRGAERRARRIRIVELLIRSGRDRPSARAIAKRLRLPRQTVQRDLKELKAMMAEGRELSATYRDFCRSKRFPGVRGKKELMLYKSGPPL